MPEASKKERGEDGMTTFETVRDVVAERLCVELVKVTLDSRLKEDLGADSLDIPEVIVELEEHFGITVADEDIVKLQTIRDVVDYIEKRVSE